MGPEFKLPLDAQTQTLIIYGGKGMGKSSCATVLAEELSAAHLKFSVIDPMGVLYGLKHAADPSGPGLDVLLLGGLHGDIPIEPTAGAVVADLVVDENVSTVIDISRRPNGTMWGVGERIRFVADYLTRLYERQGERMRPLMQLIDECGRFAPQLIPHGSPEIARCVGAVERLVEEGRNVGVGVCLITQRSARMNKSVSELAECMIAFRTVGPRSIDAIVDWFGEHVPKERWKHLVERLRALPRGTALVVSPGWLQFEGEVAIRQRWTLDTSATPTDARDHRSRASRRSPCSASPCRRTTNANRRAGASTQESSGAEVFCVAASSKAGEDEAR
jgi:DNA helicase HerA-like ATPase